MRNMSRVVVTGGAGFIGLHLTQKLIEQGNDVIVYDDLSTGLRSNVPEAARFVEGNICNFEVISKQLQGVDFVYHLAALASVPKSIDDPGLTERINVEGTINVLAASFQQGVKKVFLASSCSVYGNTPAPVQYEGSQLFPCSPYALTKMSGELWCKLYSEVYGLPTVVLRYFNVYGAYNSNTSQSVYSLVIPKFMQQASSGKPLTIFGSGEQTRDYVHIDDVVDATILAINSGMLGVYNVGTGIRTSVNVLAGYIKSSLCSSSPIVHENPRLGDAGHACANIQKIASYGWQPNRVLAEEIRKMCNALQN